MKNPCCAIALTLCFVSKLVYSAPTPILPAPDVIKPSIPFGQAKTGQLNIQFNSSEFGGDDVVVIQKSGLTWEWQSQEHAFEITKVVDAQGGVNKFPLRITRSQPFVYLTYSLKPTTKESLNNKIEIAYDFRGKTEKLIVPVNINGVCVNSDYNQQQCNPDIWTCQIDRNSYPVLRVERPANNNSSLDAIRAHDRTHRLAAQQYTIPFLQFLNATGIEVNPPPSCEINPVTFIKNPLASKVANFSWQQHSTLKIPQLVTETKVNGVVINKITVSLPELITGYSALNGGTAEYRFDVKDAPSITIEEPNATPQEVFSGQIECVLADGSFSVIRNADPLANKADAEPPKMHLIIEKP